VDEQEYSEECFCVAAAIVPADTGPRYGISVSIPATRMKPERIPEMGRAVALECRKISAKAV
jgi:DNA-binding IclR family transcriptional regulator